MMTVTVEAVEGGCVLSPQGRLTVVSTPQLRDEVAARLAAGDRLIVVDLSGTTFVDSSGLGALVSCLKSARQAGGDLRLVAPTEQVSMVLRLTNLDRILKPRASVAAALDD
ncbi:MULTISPECIES: STAS domain-containing protein [unclassified Frigoribacterium]|jgi:anti-anti-sigma factor|nr:MULTISPECIES: STAS domain-containing protein [unclassified Frigoribacterium]KQO45286.1 anti-anti-sigma factor [Frigoribacterium sp. Leaf254]KQS16336.1 anti-anti-sigma factor [Frigoribacterium sp. Leaf186]KQT36988.1 anti-anti-sigma factor [Frigoribacterium sp. Leaf415]MBF4602214.1 STAS domain-containing protein [Frigoribacterium sp. VKM Ac-1396]OII25468.1 anti-anti-sigma factor [Frigoribacterium sp. MCBA15_019]